MKQNEIKVSIQEHRHTLLRTETLTYLLEQTL